MTIDMKAAQDAVNQLPAMAVWNYANEQGMPEALKPFWPYDDAQAVVWVSIDICGVDGADDVAQIAGGDFYESYDFPNGTIYAFVH